MPERVRFLLSIAIIGLALIGCLPYRDAGAIRPLPSIAKVTGARAA